MSENQRKTEKQALRFLASGNRSNYVFQIGNWSLASFDVGGPSETIAISHTATYEEISEFEQHQKHGEMNVSDFLYVLRDLAGRFPALLSIVDKQLLWAILSAVDGRGDLLDNMFRSTQETGKVTSDQMIKIGCILKVHSYDGWQDFEKFDQEDCDDLDRWLSSFGKAIFAGRMESAFNLFDDISKKFAHRGYNLLGFL